MIAVICSILCAIEEMTDKPQFILQGGSNCASYGMSNTMYYHNNNNNSCENIIWRVIVLKSNIML